MVDSKGRSWGTMSANKSGKGIQSFTSDFEIMRGDLCKMLYEMTKDDVDYRFGIHTTEVHHDNERSNVYLSDGSSGVFDIVVGADGAGSRTRDMILDVDSKDPFQPLGVHAGYFTIPREIKDGESYLATAFITTGNRGIMTRRGDDERYQAYMFCPSKASENFAKTSNRDLEEERVGLAEAFRGGGWKTEEILEGLANAKDFYCERMGLVAMDYWSRGRIVLVGDAAWCPTAMTGMGTTCGMVGSYVLAGEIDKHFTNDAYKALDKPMSASGIEFAFREYENKMRPWIKTVQHGIADSGENYMDKFPSSSIGISMSYLAFGLVSLFRLNTLAKYMLREDTKGWKLPEYPRLDISRN